MGKLLFEKLPFVHMVIILLVTVRHARNGLDLPVACLYRILLERSHARLIAYCPWLLSSAQQRNRAVPTAAAEPKVFTIWPCIEKKLAASGLDPSTRVN